MTSPLEHALTALILASPEMKPDDLGPAIVASAEHLGGRDVVVVVGDLEQRALQPLAGEIEPQPIDTTAAGAAFRTEAPVTQRAEGGTRLWVPILDSAERVGVVGAIVDEASESVVGDWAVFAGLVGELIVTKTRYGDHLALARRTRAATLAAELRWSLLPPLTFTSRDILVAGMLEPAYEIAGDTFDYAVNGDVAHVGLFDAMGHGMEACRMANLAVGSYQHGRRTGADLVATAAATDEILYSQFGDGHFVTAQLATIDLTSGLLTTLNAGHPSPSIFRADGTFDALPVATSPPLGIVPNQRTTTTARLREGDVVLFHTDGITEARNRDGEHYGDRRLRRLVRRLIDDQLRPAEVIRQVVHAVIEHGSPLRDDATLVLVGWQLGERVLSAVATAFDEAL
jgi:hypothetical protein